MKLTGFESEDTLAVECVLPFYYRENSSIISQYLIENLNRDTPHVIYYLQTHSGVKLGKKYDLTVPGATHAFLLIKGSESFIAPQPDKVLSWRYDEKDVLIEVQIAIPNDPWALGMTEKLAEGIVAGLFPLPLIKDKKAEEFWIMSLNIAVDKLTGLSDMQSSEIPH